MQFLGIYIRMHLFSSYILIFLKKIYRFQFFLLYRKLTFILFQRNNLISLYYKFSNEMIKWVKTEEFR